MARMDAPPKPMVKKFAGRLIALSSFDAEALDAWAVKKVAEMDDWIASVKATLYPATEAGHDE